MSIMWIPICIVNIKYYLLLTFFKVTFHETIFSNNIYNFQKFFLCTSFLANYFSETNIKAGLKK